MGAVTALVYIAVVTLVFVMFIWTPLFDLLLQTRTINPRDKWKATKILLCGAFMCAIIAFLWLWQYEQPSPRTIKEWKDPPAVETHSQEEIYTTNEALIEERRKKLRKEKEEKYEDLQKNSEDLFKQLMEGNR